MADEGIGKIASRWLRSRVTEWTTGDKRTREDADAAADRAERDAKDHAVEEAILTAVPGLRRMKERQEADAAEREAERERRRRAELESRPRAAVELRVDGQFDGGWSGALPTRLEVATPDAGTGADADDDVDVDDDDDADDEETYVDPDPYATTPTLLVDLTALDGEEPDVGGHRFVSWRFQVPGYHGDGTYDLAAIAAERERAGASPDYVDWDLVVDGNEDEPFYFHADAGPATVTVSEGGRRLDVAMSVSSAVGDATVTASIRLP